MVGRGHFIKSISILSVFVLRSSCACTADCGSHVTLKELKDIVTGRCEDFQKDVHKEFFCQTGFKDCGDIWTKFESSFVSKPPCNVPADLFSNFIKTADHDIPGKQLFWSKLKGFAQKYSNNWERYITLEDTLIGYLLDGLKFCGGQAGLNSSLSCPVHNRTCPFTAYEGFWTAASENFAKKAVGNIYVLLNATQDPIIEDTSFFWKYEFPNLEAGSVDSMTALLINDSPSKKIDPCSNDKTLQKLKSGLIAKNIRFECNENPRDLVLIYCAERPSAELCNFFNIELKAV